MLVVARSVLCLALSCATLAGGWDRAAVASAKPSTAITATAYGHRPLLAVSCSSPDACTAVGGLFDERWDGLRWSARPVAVPDVSASEFDYLGGVSCATRRFCMAVGSERPPVSADVGYDYSALAEVWNGSSWSIQSPRLSQTRNGYLLGVSCPSRSRCVAVGQDVTTAFALGWNGSGWRVQLARAQPPLVSILNGVFCASATSCMAVGSVAPDGNSPSRALAERWNGVVWSKVAVPRTPPIDSAALNAISCTGGSCTAVGVVGFRQLVERWNGRHWAIQPTPTPAPVTELDGVSCPSVGDCVAVGGITSRSHQTLAERWNGTSWSVEPTPRNRRGSILWSVSCTSASHCVAAGTREGAPLIEGWNGTRWAVLGSNQ